MAAHAGRLPHRRPSGAISPVGVILLAGAIAGVFAGWRWKHTHRAFRDWRDSIARVSGLRRIFYRSGWRSLLWAVAAVVALWLIVR